jgi:putative CocE/NonD family hydrolase
MLRLDSTNDLKQNRSEKMLIQARIPFAVTLLLLIVPVLSGAEEHAITLERSVPVKMRDGVILRADIYRPQSSGKFPVLLQRTPYNKDDTADAAVSAASRGYVVVVQDVRGRYTSEGEWYPFKYESIDGYDTIEWAAALPYSDGRVGMFGSSYVGATQMLAAIAHPPHLAGICPADTASNYHDGWIYQNGAFEQWLSESWTTILAQDTATRYLRNLSNAVEGSSKLPLSKYPLFSLGNVPDASHLTTKFAPYFMDWLAHPNFDNYWREWSIEDHYPDIQVPALTISAWYDIFQGGALRNYLGMKTHSGNEFARRNQRLIVAIGGHAGSGRKIGDVDFGPTAAFDDDDVTITLDWYDFLFKGAQNEFATEKPVKIFVMGVNAWRDEEAWPPIRAVNTRYFLHSGGRANSASGDGSLSEAAPIREPSDSYVYNPADPVPTTGGPLCCDSIHLEPGPRDQRPVELRKDVLVYSTLPFTQGIEVTGAIRVELYAKSSAFDTDFTAKMVDVSPDGLARNLTEGIVRAKYRDSQMKPSLLNPGQVYKFEIDLLSTSNVFQAGHRLRLEISSSNFPRFDRNLNSGEDSSRSDRFVTATNVILHDAEHPSALTVPQVPR